MTDPITAGPPRNTDTEAKVIGCLFLLLPSERAFFLERLSPDDFHDPMYSWLFRGLRVWGVVLDGIQLYERLADMPGKPTNETLACVVALTIFFRDGSNRIRVAMLPYHIAELKRIAQKRKRYDEGIQLIIENHHHDFDAGDWVAN